MRSFVFIFFYCLSVPFFAQDAQLALQYLRIGEYEKAASLYKILSQKNPYNTNYTTYLIDCYQQLEDYEKATLTINKVLQTIPNQDYLYIELGYNFQLQHRLDKAIPFYEKALESIKKEPRLGYQIGRTFQNNHLLDYALKAYKKAMVLNPSVSYNYQIANIYGEKAEIENMFITFLDMISRDEKYLPTVKSQMGRFVTDDPQNDHNLLLKKLVLKRLQNNPSNSWNELLSWLYLQQKDYDKALIQEKALFQRNPISLKNIINVGEIAFENKSYEVAIECFNYVLENTQILETILISKFYLLEISIESDLNIQKIESRFQELFRLYGINNNTISLQLIYADFLTFKKNEPEKAINVLKQALELPINKFQKGALKSKLANILVFTNKFSTALIYYSQVQNNLKNHEIGQEARFKIAQTSYFKGDFEWAQSQLKVLKNSTSQLIANDALDLNLLITDNSVKDSLKLALKKFAQAELLAYQGKNLIAIDTLHVILNNFKGHPLEDECLFKQAELFELTFQFEKAENNYLKLIKINKEDILVDDASYNLAELYFKKLNNPNKAMEFYQKIIFEFPSSIYLVDARKKYRKLRGDDLN